MSARLLGVSQRIDYEARWLELDASPTQVGTVLAVVLRLGDAQHQEIESGTVDYHLGLIGDRWSRGPRVKSRQLSLISQRTLLTLSPDPTRWRLSGDNLIVDLDLSEAATPAGTELEIGETLLRVSTTPHLGCSRFAHRFGEEARAWVNQPEHRHLRLRGVYCEVVQGGVVRRQMTVRHLTQSTIA